MVKKIGRVSEEMEQNQTEGKRYDKEKKKSMTNN
jgi:hypothetical protein